MVVEEFPFTQHEIGENIFIREFSKDVLSEELVWHRDRKNRIIEVIHGKNWQLQLDNQMPVSLVEGLKYEIPANTYHRVKRGTTNLTVKIQEI